MKSTLRVVPLLLLATLVLGLALPTAAQGKLLSDVAPNCDYGGEFKAIEAVDPATVKFTLCHPDAAFLAKVAFQSFEIAPSEYIDAQKGGGDMLEKPIGTGPYKLDKWDKGTQVVMSRFDDYWGDKAKTKTLVFKWNSEASARLVDLQSGNVDGIDNIAPADFDVVKNDSSLALYQRPVNNIMYLGINNTVKPFDNQKVRQALAYGIDRKRIVDNFYPKGSTVATQFMPPVFFGYTKEVDPFPYDPEKAKQLLADSGVPLPIKTTLSYRDVVRPYLPTPGVVATDIQAQLKDIGIDVDINVMESGAFLDAAQAGKLSLHLLGWIPDFPDPTDFLDFHFGAGASDQFGNKFKEITDPVAQAGQVSDPAKRYPLYVQANTAIRDLVPMVPIANGASAAAFKATIKDAHASPLTDEKFAVMENTAGDTLVWEQNSEPISMYCPDEEDGETFRVCGQIFEPLYGYEVGGTNPIPKLATECTASSDELTWTCKLRQGVKFQDGSDFDANDVVASFVAQWDAASPNHTGRQTNFTYFSSFFGPNFLNAKSS
jgi:ABC-type transport system substrate-binding protein